jgi:hypothetical protein
LLLDHVLEALDALAAERRAELVRSPELLVQRPGAVTQQRRERLPLTAEELRLERGAVRARRELLQPVRDRAEHEVQVVAVRLERLLRNAELVERLDLRLAPSPAPRIAVDRLLKPIVSCLPSTPRVFATAAHSDACFVVSPKFLLSCSVVFASSSVVSTAPFASATAPIAPASSPPPSRPP